MEIEEVKLSHSGYGYPTLLFVINRSYRESIDKYNHNDHPLDKKMKIGFNGLFWQVWSPTWVNNKFLKAKYIPQFDDQELVNVDFYCNGYSSFGLFQKKVVIDLIKEHNLPLRIADYEAVWDGELYPYNRKEYVDSTVFYKMVEFKNGLWIARSAYSKSLNGYSNEVILGDKYPDKASAIFAINEFAETGIIKRYDDPTKYLPIEKRF